MLRGELFSTDMVRAYLAGRKLHTARPVAPKEMHFADGTVKPFDLAEDGGDGFAWMVYRNFRTPAKAKHRPGDYIYCRETWADLRGMGFGNNPATDKPWNFAYKSDVKPGSDGDRARLDYGVKWRPSTHMPREAARLFFRVTKVEVVRLEDVTEEFAREDGFEGVDLIPARNPEDAAQVISAKQQFEAFWRSTYGDARWMWVYWTEPCSREEAMGGGKL